MTDIHSTAKTNKTQTTQPSLRDASQRHYTVGYINVRHESKTAPTKTRYSKHPALHLKGNWLEQAGLLPAKGLRLRLKRDGWLLRWWSKYNIIKKSQFLGWDFLIN